MRKIVLLMLLCALLLCGCSTLMDGSYYSVTPHSAQKTTQPKENAVVSTYEELRTALVDMAESGYQKSTFYIQDFPVEMATAYMQEAIDYIFTDSAIGAYAVDEVNYEVGNVGGRDAVVVSISYLHDRSEILRMRKTGNMSVAAAVVTKALENCDAGIVLEVMNYEDVDWIQLVESYVNDNPQTCMEMPQVSVALYPNQGTERVVSMNFTYQTDRDVLRSMRDTVSPVFSAAEMYVRGNAEQSQKFEQLYAFLMERFDYKIKTSITPAYSLLQHGVGDSKAFATVYAAMCRNAGLKCQVINGTKMGEPYSWNQICIDGFYYHLDLLQCSKENAFVIKPAGQMDGYVWDYSAYD